MHHKLHSAETVESEHDRSNFEERSTEKIEFICLKFANLAISSYEQNHIKNRKITEVGSRWLRQLFGRIFCTSYNFKDVNKVTYLYKFSNRKVKPLTEDFIARLYNL